MDDKNFRKDFPKFNPVESITLGSGSFGSVYEVELNGTIYALKCCEIETNKDLQLIDKEIQTNQKIDPNVNLL